MTNTLDSGAGSLRDAVGLSNGTAANDVVVFNIPAASCSGAGVCTITLGSEIQVTNNGALTILGTGANRLTIDGGTGNNRIFYSNGAAFTLTGATLTGGDASGASPTTLSGTGGAIYANGGTLVVRSVYFSGNTANASSRGGGAVYIGGGANHSIFNSTFSGNTAGGNLGRGGAILVDGNAGVTASGSTFTANFAPNGGAGAIALTTGSFSLLSSTVTENTASAFLGGGGILTQGDFSFSNSIIAGNVSASGSLHEFRVNGGTTTSLGYNVVGDTAGDAASTSDTITYLSTDILDTPPLLDVLANYGGTVPTRRLQAASPAIDKGSAIAGIFSDDRAAIRPNDIFTVPTNNASGGNGADIGAFEVVPVFARGWGNNAFGAVGDGTIGTPASRQTPALVKTDAGGKAHGIAHRAALGRHGLDLGRRLQRTAR